jgi:hypothetical protein
MKTKTLANILNFTHRQLIRHRLAAWLTGLALLIVGIPVSSLAVEVLYRETFDKYPNMTQDGSGGAKMIVTNGQAVLQHTKTTPTDPNNILSTWTSWKTTRTFNMPPGSTIELRTDFLNANQDNTFVNLLVEDMAAYAGIYVVFMDRNEITLFKMAAPPNLFYYSYFFWDQVAFPNAPLTLSLRFTSVGEDLQIETLVLNQAKADAVVYRKTVFDTAGEDKMLPNHSVHGLLMHPEEIVKPFGMKNWYACVGITYINPNQGPSVPAELTIDNFQVLEYSAPILEIARSICLSWPEDTFKEQIVVGAASVDGPWTPWPEPIFKRNGQICMSVAATSEQQFFKLVPGTQFIDNFNPPQRPYASKGEWVTEFNNPLDATRLVITNIDGALRYHSIKAPSDGRCQLVPPGPDLVVGNFSASLDILDWDPNSMEQGVSIGVGTYYGIVYFNAATKGQGVLHLSHVEEGARAGHYFSVVPGKHYRLCFSEAGATLTLRIYDLANLELPLSEVQLIDKAWKQGSVLLALAIYSSSAALTVDNFFVTGTKP